MGKKKLSNKQTRNQAKIRADRIRRSERTAERIEQQLKTGQLGDEQPGLLVAHHGVHLIVEDKQGNLHQCKCRKTIDALATGDEVVWRAFKDGSGVIVAVQERKQVLARPAGRKVRPMAANVDLMVIVIAPEPIPMMTTVDRYLVMSELLGIEPLLVVNKMDLMDDKPHSEFKALLDVYDNLDYHWIKASSKNNDGLKDLREALKDKTSVFVGQSGVGKSSLISSLVPNVEIQVGKLSDAKLLGKHTTTCSRLYHLPQGGNLIDSPGIRRFGLWHLPKETLIQGFKEFAPYIGQCKFRNCQHLNEPECALVKAAQLGQIAAKRLDNYHALIDSHEKMQTSPYKK